MLNPVVTKPNTRPNAPGGVTARTIMSRDGCSTPLKKPDNPNRPIKAAAPRSKNAIGTSMPGADRKADHGDEIVTLRLRGQ